MSFKWRAFLAVGLLALALDQGTKWGVRSHLEPDLVRPVLGEFFGLLRIEGSPNVFGFLGELSGAALIVVSVAGLALPLALLLRSDARDALAGTALGAIVGGAAGNLVDRFYYSSMLDFMRFDLGVFVFPSFNLGDACIAIGAGLLLLDIAASEASEVADSDGGPPS